jgi:hypothetical protein
LEDVMTITPDLLIVPTSLGLGEGLDRDGDVHLILTFVNPDDGLRTGYKVGPDDAAALAGAIVRWADAHRDAR